MVVDRVADLLECFASDAASLGVTELAARSGLPKATVHRLAAGLQRRGFLVQDEETRRYRLGPALLSLGSLAASKHHIVEALQPHMAHIRDLTRETVLLSLRMDGHRHFTAYQVESHYDMRMSAVIGRARPLFLGCGGKAILAFRSPQEREHVLSTFEGAYTASGIFKSREVIAEELDEVRRNGYADTTEEQTPGATGVSVPILDQNGLAFASLYVVGLVSRFAGEGKRAALEALRAAAETATSPANALHE